MSLTLGLTGMDPATEAALKAAFVDANARLSGGWNLVPESEAGHVMVDMDSMYGPMSWLRLHAAGKRVIGLTTAPRTQTDFRLGRPFDSDAFADLLRAVATDSGVTMADAPVAAAAQGAPVASAPAPAMPVESPVHEAVEAPVAPLPAAAPAGLTVAPAPQDQLPEEIPLPASAEAAAPSEPLPAPPIEMPAAEPVAASPAEIPSPEPVAAPRELRLADWLVPGALTRRVRYRRQTGPSLLVDPAARIYHGPSTLKPFAAYFDGVVVDGDFESLDDAAWARDSAVAGAAQPLQRLQWLGALVVGHLALAADGGADARFRLNKWPQTEREYPKHFRIATAMMKGPATLADIAETSAMPVNEVADFVHASLATGFAERVVETPPEPVEPPRPTGLLGRLRGR